LDIEYKFPAAAVAVRPNGGGATGRIAANPSAAYGQRGILWSYSPWHVPTLSWSW
jgi:hypothetical protein